MLWHDVSKGLEGEDRHWSSIEGNIERAVACESPLAVVDADCMSMGPRLDNAIDPGWGLARVVEGLMKSILNMSCRPAYTAVSVMSWYTEGVPSLVGMRKCACIRDTLQYVVLLGASSSA